MIHSPQQELVEDDKVRRRSRAFHDERARDIETAEIAREALSIAQQALALAEARRNPKRKPARRNTRKTARGR